MARLLVVAAACALLGFVFLRDAKSWDACRANHHIAYCLTTWEN